MMGFSSSLDTEMRTLDIFINNTEEGPNEFVSRFTTLTKARKASLVDEILCASVLTDGCGSMANNTGHCGNVCVLNTESISKELRDPKERSIFLETNVFNIMRSTDMDASHELLCCANDEVSDVEAGKQMIANDSIECIDLDGVEDINAGNLALCFSSTDAMMYPTTFDNFFNDCNSANTRDQVVRTELIEGMKLSKSPQSSLPSLDDFLAVESEEEVVSGASRNFYPSMCALVSETLRFSEECHTEAAMDTKLDDTSLNSQDGCVSRCESEDNLDLLLPGLTKDESRVVDNVGGVAGMRKVEFSSCVLSEKWHERLKGIIVEPDDCVHPFTLNADYDYEGVSVSEAL
ncbi:unnamed protein product [Phytomonas sp. EM1]|nr:unnamed protein product [Phytomonas sp. EM1]|eukprot:CCW63278.1 unnamed protein product [Phytomonas sp. isolate EM1]